VIAEPLAAAVGAFTMSAVGLVWLARATLGRPRPATLRPRATRVPRQVAPERVVPEAVALDWGYCPECTARRYGQVHVDGSFTCGSGHHIHITTEGETCLT
jgi:hypothetical protein